MLWWHGTQAAGEYVTGYLIEKSLSIDNVFVWAVIFSYFAVPKKYQFRTLFWGIFGALVLRAIFIFAGVALVDEFSARSWSSSKFVVRPLLHAPVLKATLVRLRTEPMSKPAQAFVTVLQKLADNGGNIPADLL